MHLICDCVVKESTLGVKVLGLHSITKEPKNSRVNLPVSDPSSPTKTTYIIITNYYYFSINIH